MASLTVVAGLLATSVWASPTGPSTILTVLIDDLGFYDTAVHNPNIVSVTPNLHSLVGDGLRLDRFYVYKYCSPTRRSFLSGRFPIHITGTQSDICDNCLPLNFTLLSQKLASAGWINHFIGKGHLGYLTMDHLPINRGFASHVGYLHGSEDYSYGNHSQEYFKKDFWDGLAPGVQDIDEIYYSTNYYTTTAVNIIKEHPADKNLWVHLPYQAVHSPYTDSPSWEQVPESAPIWDHTFGDMLYVVDDGIGNVTAELKASGRWANTLAIFSSDNGGIGPGNNYPLRGHKMTPWEGGTRVMAFIAGGFLPEHLRGTVNTNVIHIADWYPTLLNLVGVDPTDTIHYNGVVAPIDGMDVWPAIVGTTNVTHEWLPVTEVSLLWNGRYKLLREAYSTNWYTPNCTHLTDNRTEFPCVDGSKPSSTTCLVCSNSTPCLFDVVADPGEYRNLAAIETDIVQQMTTQLETYSAYVTCQMTPEELEPYNCSSPSGQAWGPAAGYTWQFAGPCCFRKSVMGA
eukprot:m.197762 g.197762  ORF g.197762 m.197762 type:complete len:512 (+) comp20214_c0_seq1:161-1696(+)